MEQTLAALAEYLHGRVIGDGTISIRGVNSLDRVSSGEVTFAESPHHLIRALETNAAGVIVSSSVTELKGHSGISVGNPKLAFALLLELFNPSECSQGFIHPSAVVAKDAQIGERVDICANAFIGNRVRIGSDTIIEPGACVGDDVTIGDFCLIGPSVVIYRQTIISNRVRIHGGSVIGGDGFGYVFHEGRYVKMPQIGNVIIEDDVEIGCNSCVDRATVGSTVIQQGTKIDNLVQIAHNNRVGRHVVIAGQVGLAGSVTVGDYTRLGGQVGVIDHITLGDQVEAGAGSLIIKSVPSGQKVFGYPARLAHSALQQMASLSRLPTLLKTLTRLILRITKAEQRLQHLEDHPQK